MSTAQPFKIEQLSGYFGGKGSEGTVQRIINEIPPHHTFVSPFLGHCAVMRYKRPAENNWGFDLDAAVIASWKRYAPKWVTVQQRDALTWLAWMKEQCEKGNVDRNTFVFLDPPYLEGTTRGAIKYDHLLNYDEHVRMLRILPSLTCNVMLCGLPNILNDTQLPQWRTIQYKNKTRHGMQWEQLWMNYAKPERLHDPRFVGTTFRERERIKRTVNALQRLIRYQSGTKRERSSIEQQHIIEQLKSALP